MKYDVVIVGAGKAGNIVAAAATGLVAARDIRKGLNNSFSYYLMVL